MSNSSHHLAGAWLYRVGRYRRCKIPLRTPSPGSLNTQDWKKMRFSIEIAVYLENGKLPIDPCRFSDLERQDAMGQFFFWQMSIITPVCFDLEWQNLARQRVMKVMRMIQPRTHSKGRGPQRPPKFLEPPPCVHTVWETATQFCTVIKLDVRKKNYRVDHGCWRAICIYCSQRVFVNCYVLHRQKLRRRLIWPTR